MTASEYALACSGLSEDEKAAAYKFSWVLHGRQTVDFSQLLAGQDAEYRQTDKHAPLSIQDKSELVGMIQSASNILAELMKADCIFAGCKYDERYREIIMDEEVGID